MARMFALVAALSLLLAAAGTSVRADDDDNPRTPISRESILGALHSSGIGIEPGQMELLSGMTAAEPNPPLKVLSIDLLDADSDKVLLRCEHPNACLPFYVLVHWSRPKGEPSASSGPDAAPAQADLPAKDLLVRSGKTAVLILDGEYVHMRLPVLCLQNGGRGQRVRVISRDTKKRYLARVTGRGVVTSALSD
jgi:hypothetical protein